MSPKEERGFHRKLGARCFNETWDYLEKKDRTQDDNREMLFLAHASRYHWGIVGTPRNWAVGDWQVSRVYAALKQPELSLLFAMSALKTCREEKLSEVLISAYEGVARAYSVAKDKPPGLRYLRLARSQLTRVELDAEDRRLYQTQIDETAKLLR